MVTCLPLIQNKPGKPTQSSTMAANYSEDFFRNLHLFFYTKPICVLS